MLAYTELGRLARNGLVEPAALPSVFIVFVFYVTQVYASKRPLCLTITEKAFQFGRLFSAFNRRFGD